MQWFSVTFVCQLKINVSFQLNERKYTTNKTNSMALSPQAYYTDWATATCRRNLVPIFVDRGVSSGQRGGSSTVVNLSYLDQSRYISFQYLLIYSHKGWVDHIPDPLLLRKSGSAGNRTRDLWVSSQELWLPDYRGGRKYTTGRIKCAISEYYLHCTLLACLQTCKTITTLATEGNTLLYNSLHTRMHYLHHVLPARLQTCKAIAALTTQEDEFFTHRIWVTADSTGVCMLCWWTCI
jgi:hypothetical protein